MTQATFTTVRPQDGYREAKTQAWVMPIPVSYLLRFGHLFQELIPCEGTKGWVRTLVRHESFSRKIYLYTKASHHFRELSGISQGDPSYGPKGREDKPGFSLPKWEDDQTPLTGKTVALRQNKVGRQAL